MPDLSPEATLSVISPAITANDQAAADAEMDALVAEIKGKIAVENGEAAAPPTTTTATTTVVTAGAAATPAPPSEAATLMAKIAAMETEMAAMRKSQSAPPDWLQAVLPQKPAAPAPRPTSITVDQLRYDPNAALEAAGIDVEELAQHMVVKAMGKNAPESMRLKAQLAPQLGALNAATESKIAALSQRLEHYERQDRMRSYEKSLDDHATGVKPEEYPMIGTALAADRVGVLEDLKGIAREDAAYRMATGESGPPLTAPEAYARLEQRYAAIHRRLAPKAPDQSPQVGTPAAKKPAPAATMASLQGAPTRTAPMSLKEEDDALWAEIKKTHGVGV